MGLNDMGFSSGLIPSFPHNSSGRKNEAAVNPAGRRLMALVRSIEKDDERRPDMIREAAEILIDLTNSYSRRGLLEGDTIKARNVLDSSSGRVDAVSQVNRRSNKRARIDLRHSSLDDNTTESKEQASGAEDELLVLSAALRILGGSRKLEVSEHQSIAVDMLNLVSLSSRLCSCVADFAHQHESMCALAERELLNRIGKSFLAGLATALQSLAPCTTGNKDVSCIPRQRAVIACLQATSALTCLFQAKLSRCSSIILNLETTAWRLLRCRNIETQRRAAELLSNIPLTGATKKDPAVAWRDDFSDAAESLAIILDAVAPIAKISAAAKSSTSTLTHEMQTRVSAWMTQMKDIVNDEKEMSAVLMSTTQGLVFLVGALLAREGYDTHSSLSMIATRVPVDALLDVVQRMISFPTAAELVFYSTKKVLRLELIEGGLLSISSVTAYVANPVKSLGHDVLDIVVSTIGGSLLLPFGSRIIQITQSSLLSASSLTVRRMLEPASNVQIHPKRKLWLHSSVALRTKVIRSFGLAVLEFGSNVVVSPQSDVFARRRHTSRGCVKGIAIVAGCLLEQVSHSGDEQEDRSTDDWGSFLERAEHVVCACESLGAILCAAGPYLPMDTRAIVDSIAGSMLQGVSGSDPSRPLLQVPSVRVAILNLGSVCLTTPWPDGAMSDIMTQLRATASKCHQQQNEVLSNTSWWCLRQCDALIVPRAPPLDNISVRQSSTDTLTEASLREGLRKTNEVRPTEDSSKTEHVGKQNESPRVAEIQNDLARYTGSGASNKSSDGTDPLGAPHPLPSSHTSATVPPRDARAESQSFVERVPLVSMSDHTLAQETEPPRADDEKGTPMAPDGDEREACEFEGPLPPLSLAVDDSGKPLFAKDADGSDEEDLLPAIVDFGPDEGDC